MSYSGNAINSFGLTETKSTIGEASTYSFYIKEVSTEAARENYEGFARDNNLLVKEEHGLIIYESK